MPGKEPKREFKVGDKIRVNLHHGKIEDAVVKAAAIAVWRQSLSAKVVWASLAVAALIYASYRVWANERKRAAETIKVLNAEISELKRKPYQQELVRQAEALVAKLSNDGKTLLRHLVVHGPIENGRQFLPTIPQPTTAEITLL